MNHNSILKRLIARENFFEYEHSLLCLEMPATGTYPEPDKSHPRLHTILP